MINYILQIESNGNTITKKTTHKDEFLRIVMLYAIGSYDEKLKVYNDLVKKAEDKLQKLNIIENEQHL